MSDLVTRDDMDIADQYGGDGINRKHLAFAIAEYRLKIVHAAIRSMAAADDDLQIDEAWLRSVGFIENENGTLVARHPNWSCGGCAIGRYCQVAVIENILYVNGMGVNANPTRGQLRNLLRALGIPTP